MLIDPPMTNDELVVQSPPSARVIVSPAASRVNVTLVAVIAAFFGASGTTGPSKAAVTGRSTDAFAVCVEAKPWLCESVRTLPLTPLTVYVPAYGPPTTVIVPLEPRFVLVRLPAGTVIVSGVDAVAPRVNVNDPVMTVCVTRLAAASMPLPQPAAQSVRVLPETLAIL